MAITTFLTNTIAAVVFGGLIGLERQWRQHPAGLRTNALVTLGAALFVGLSALLQTEASPSRIAAQVVSGLGFLGGGVILREGCNFRGLNTTATLWCSGALGTLCGAGFLREGGVGTIIVMTVHVSLRPLMRWIDDRKKKRVDLDAYYRLRVECDADRDAQIRQILLRQVGDTPHLSLPGLSTDELENHRTAVVADIFSTQRCDRGLEQIVLGICIERDVKAIRWQRTDS